MGLRKGKRKNPGQQRKNAAGVPEFEGDSELWRLFTGQASSEASLSFRDLWDNLPPDDHGQDESADDASRQNETNSLPKKRRPGHRLAEIPPGNELDLHGLTAAQAVRRLLLFLDSRKRLGVRLARVITGKGLHSNGPAVLPDAVEAALGELMKKREIAGYCWESGRKETSGSIIIRLCG